MKKLNVLTFNPGDTIIKDGQSKCTVCNKLCPAQWLKRGSNPATIHIRRTCRDHGVIETCICSDARFYWPFKGPDCCKEKTLLSASGSNPCCLGGNSAGSDHIEKLATCVALIEIMHACNWDCPTCFADSPTMSFGGQTEYDFDDIKLRIEGVIARKGVIDILQLSGGEPTLHSRFIELLAWTCSHPSIKYVLIVTNGSRFATDSVFVAKVAEIRRRFDNVMLYMQFDGTQIEGQTELRGQDRRKIREVALTACKKAEIAVTLAMTLTHDNLPFVWDAVDFGLKHSNIRGITFQPEFLSRRNAETSKVRKNSISVADVVYHLVQKSAEVLTPEDFTALPCGDPNCATLTYLFKTPEGLRSVRHYMDLGEIAEHLKTTIHHTLEDLKTCGCENPAGEALKAIENDSQTFRIMIKPFMGSDTWDEDRIKRCCTHVIREDGRLDSFCRHYAAQAVE